MANNKKTAPKVTKGTPQVPAFKIEKDVPIPPQGMAVQKKYPEQFKAVHDMEVGDSIKFESKITNIVTGIKTAIMKSPENKRRNYLLRRIDDKMSGIWRSDDKKKWGGNRYTVKKKKGK